MITGRSAFREFERKQGQAIYVSATPGDYELGKSRRHVVEQLIRPTGLLDPEVIVRPARNQVDDLLEEIRKRVEQGERVMATTLTKRLAEDLTDYYQDIGIKVRYLHSDIDTIERVEILRALRRGTFDVLIGINPAARRAGHPRGVPGGDSRRRQGGLSALLSAR